MKPLLTLQIVFPYEIPTACVHHMLIPANRDHQSSSWRQKELDIACLHSCLRAGSAHFSNPFVNILCMEPFQIFVGATIYKELL